MRKRSVSSGEHLSGITVGRGIGSEVEKELEECKIYYECRGAQGIELPSQDGQE